MPEQARESRERRVGYGVSGKVDHIIPTELCQKPFFSGIGTDEQFRLSVDLNDLTRLLLST